MRPVDRQIQWDTSDVRKMARLLAETATVGGRIADRKRHFLCGLSELIEAESWEFQIDGRLALSERQYARLKATNAGVSARGTRQTLTWEGEGLRFRAARRISFADRETRIAHTLLSHCAAFLKDSHPKRTQPSPISLPPRQTEILLALLRGSSRKNIANTLGISINTVAGYVRDIYRIHGVSSHSELMTRVKETRQNEQI